MQHIPKLMGVVQVQLMFGHTVAPSNILQIYMLKVKMKFLCPLPFCPLPLIIHGLGLEDKENWNQTRLKSF